MGINKVSANIGFHLDGPLLVGFGADLRLLEDRLQRRLPAPQRLELRHEARLLLAEHARRGVDDLPVLGDFLDLLRWY